MKAIFEIHRDFCSLPIKELAAQAIQFARQGVKLNPLQAYIFKIVHSIHAATPQARKIFCDSDHAYGPRTEGKIFAQPELADTLEILSIEGANLFYRGEIAQAIVRECEEAGGHLSLSDLGRYQLIRREPLTLHYRGSRILTNPPPSTGGILIAFALELLKEFDSKSWKYGSASYLQLLTRVMALTNQARADLLNDNKLSSIEFSRLLEPNCLKKYRSQLTSLAPAQRGTTHISVMDAQSNIASMTVSNGEGCGSIVPGTGIMLNNMLGEEDLSPEGFQNWPEGQRMSSMMSPCIVHHSNGTLIATGSGGSNRIRTALLQVLINLIDFRMDIESAVHSSRLHLEGQKLSVEGGFKPGEVERLIRHYPEHEIWNERNLFFGGAHTVEQGPKGFNGVGDPRRGGVSCVVE